MPGVLHQGILSIFRDDPWLGFDLLGIDRPVVGTPLDRRAEVEDPSVDDPTKIKTGFPDVVLVWRDPDDPSCGVVICIEAQGGPNPRKRWRIPFYHASLADDHELPTWVFVVSFSERASADIASWRVGPPPRVDAHVLDVNNVPRIISLERALERPTLAVLSAALHGHAGDLEVARVGLRAARRERCEKRRDAYTRTILAALTKPQRDILIGELPMKQHDPLWEIERNSGTYHVGWEAGLEAGTERGLEQGLERGLERGRRQTLVEMILALLEVRGVDVSAAVEAEIRACETLATLERWARRAREVERDSQLFEPG